MDETDEYGDFWWGRRVYGERDTGFPQRGRTVPSDYAYPPETILSHSFYLKNKEEFYRFYHDKMLITDVEPNAAHRKLAELERAGKLTAVITQNIDGLHQKAGSRRVLELHGSIHRNYCEKCGKFLTRNI